MTDMVAAYSVKPVNLESADQVKTNAAHVLAFRRAFYSKPKAKPKPPQPKKPGILECGVWPDWVNEFVHGHTPETNVIEASFPVARPFEIYRHYPRIDDIVRIVAKFYQVNIDDILSARRTANIVLPRQIGCYLAKTMTLQSLPEIGRRMGGRDHTTILWAVRKIERLRGTDDRIADEIALLRMKISDHLAKQNQPFAAE